MPNPPLDKEEQSQWNRLVALIRHVKRFPPRPHDRGRRNLLRDTCRRLWALQHPCWKEEEARAMEGFRTSAHSTWKECAMLENCGQRRMHSGG